MLKSPVAMRPGAAAAAETDREAAAAAAAAAAATTASPSSHLGTPVRASTPRAAAAAVTPLPAVASSARAGPRASAVTEVSDEEDAATASSGTPAGVSSKAGAATPAGAGVGGLFSRGRSALRSLSKGATGATPRGGAAAGSGAVLDDVSAMVPAFVAQQVATAHGIYGPTLDVGGFMAALGYADFSGPTPRGAVRAVFEDALHATRPGASPLWSAWDAQLAAAAHARLAEWRDTSAPVTPRSATAAQTA